MTRSPYARMSRMIATILKLQEAARDLRAQGDNNNLMWAQTHLEMAEVELLQAKEHASHHEPKDAPVMDAPDPKIGESQE